MNRETRNVPFPSRQRLDERKGTLAGAAAAALCLLLSLSCGGPISLGNGSTNEIAPNAPIDATGSFTPGQTGTNAVSGNVTIYNLGSGSYEVFLNSFSGPSSIAGLLLTVTTTSGSTVLSTALTSRSGNMGYIFNAPAGTSFSMVAVYQPSLPGNLNQANMSASS